MMSSPKRRSSSSLKHSRSHGTVSFPQLCHGELILWRLYTCGIKSVEDRGVQLNVEAKQHLTFFMTGVGRISLMPRQDISALLNHNRPSPYFFPNISTSSFIGKPSTQHFLILLLSGGTIYHIQVQELSWCTRCEKTSHSKESRVQEHDPPCKGHWPRYRSRADTQSRQPLCPHCQQTDKVRCRWKRFGIMLTSASRLKLIAVVRARESKGKGVTWF